MDKQSGWVSWPKDALLREIQQRMHYFYGQTDGTMVFPNSAEGDLLKIVSTLLSKLEATNLSSEKE